VKDRFGRSSLVGQPSPTGVPSARTAVTHETITHEVDVDVIAVRRPMALEVVEKGRPVGLEVVRLEESHRERKPIVDPDERRRTFGQLLDEPMCQSLPGPVPPGARRWRDLYGRGKALRGDQAQRLRLSVGVRAPE